MLDEEPEHEEQERERPGRDRRDARDRQPRLARGAAGVAAAPVRGDRRLPEHAARETELAAHFFDERRELRLARDLVLAFEPEREAQPVDLQELALRLAARTNLLHALEEALARDGLAVEIELQRMLAPALAAVPIGVQDGLVDERDERELRGLDVLARDPGVATFFVDAVEVLRDARAQLVLAAVARGRAQRQDEGDETGREIREALHAARALLRLESFLRLGGAAARPRSFRPAAVVA